MIGKSFDEIMNMIDRACDRYLSDGTDGLSEIILKCATQIYIEQMRAHAEIPHEAEDIPEDDNPMSEDSPQTSKWVDVNDDLPAPGEEVIVYMPNSYPDVGCGYLSLGNHAAHWRIYNGIIGERNLAEVTHWLPLDLPEEAYDVSCSKY